MLAFLAALALTAADTDADQRLLDACAEQGGTPDECACGLDLAKQKLTEREIALFAELTPYLERDDYAAAFAEAMVAADALGYEPAELINAIGVISENAKAVEAQCAEDDPA